MSTLSLKIILPCDKDLNVAFHKEKLHEIFVTYDMQTTNKNDVVFYHFLKMFFTVYTYNYLQNFISVHLIYCEILQAILPHTSNQKLFIKNVL